MRAKVPKFVSGNGGIDELFGEAATVANHLRIYLELFDLMAAVAFGKVERACLSKEKPPKSSFYTWE